MNCLFPLEINVRTKYGEYPTKVPCGKCLLCLKRDQDNWTTRLYFELRDHRPAHFVTLTYAPEKLPTVVDPETGEIFGTLRPKDVQDLIKRFRENFYKEFHQRRKFSYFLCGEYGKKKKRPHYHILFFGLYPEEVQKIEQDWNSRHGFTLNKQVDLSNKSLYNVSAYVSKYANKGIFAEDQFKRKRRLNPNRHKGSFESMNQPRWIYDDPLCYPEFRRLSNGIGKSYLTQEVIDYHLCKNVNFEDSNEQSKEIINRRRIEIPLDNPTDKTTSISCILPRYYSKKIFGENNFLTDSNFRAVLSKSRELRDKQLSQLRGNESRKEKIRLLDLQEIERLKLSAKTARSRISKFYDKSIF